MDKKETTQIFLNMVLQYFKENKLHELKKDDERHFIIHVKGDKPSIRIAIKYLKKLLKTT